MRCILSSATVLTILQLCATTLGVNLVVPSNEGNKTSPIMYGIMFEDINHSGDGGLYAELVRNRAFQGSGRTTTPTLAAYRAVGGANISIDTGNPLSSALPNVLKVSPTSVNTAEIGFLNEGFWGIDVKSVPYSGSFYVKGAYRGTFTVSLKSNLTTTVFAEKKIRSQSKADSWTKHEYVLHPNKAAPNVNNTLQITFDASKVEDGLLFSLISLFPPTYHNRKNGLRKDIAENLEAFKPTFLRFPGGNNLEGDDPPYRWKWNETIGPLIDRPGRPGTWSYENTDGLGLVEYMLWCDDMKLEPILGVWAGFYLNGPVVPKEELGIYVQDALDQLEFLMGPVNSTYGSLRAKLGHPKPWKINYVEVGNEDDLGGGGSSYSAYRFPMFHDAIKAAYPHITTIASTTNISPIPEGAWLDYHRYTRPDDFVSRFNFFDNMDRSHPILVGEYAYVQDNRPQGGGTDWALPKSNFPTLIGALSEAVFAIGMERNADLVRSTAYAPVLQNLNSYQWTPDLISFTADPAETALSISYYVQKLFSMHHGTTVLPVTSDTGFGPLYWSASKTDHGEYYLKIANYNGTTSNITFEVPDSTVVSGKLTTLSAPAPFSWNTPKNETSIWIEKTITKGADGKFTFELPNLTVAVLAVG